MRVHTVVILVSFVACQCFSQCANEIHRYTFENSDEFTKEWSVIEGDGCLYQDCGWSDNELQYYKQENTYIKDGKLIIKAEDEDFGIGYFTSAALISKKTFSSERGSIEINTHLPQSSVGSVPQIYLIPHDTEEKSVFKNKHISILRFIGKRNLDMYAHMNDNGEKYSSNYHNFGPSLDVNHHTVTVQWDSTKVQWLLNGFKYGESVVGFSSILKDSFRIVIAMPIGGYEAGNPNGTSSFPMTWQIDDIFIYDKNNFPILVGPQQVIKGSKDIAMTVLHSKSNSEYLWNYEANVQDIRGINDSISICNWREKSGNVSVEITDECRSYHYNLDIQSIDGKVKKNSLENFDDDALIDSSFITGVLTENVNNPQPNTINTSNLCGQYVRNLIKQYDVLFYSVEHFDATEFVSGGNKFYLDIFTHASVGTEILLQLEDDDIAGDGNFPQGRHSRYRAYTTKTGEWQRLMFSFVDLLDTTVNHIDINSMVFLFAPNSFTNDTFYFDNFDVYGDYVNIVPTFNEKQAQIYPNPATNEITIQSNVELTAVQCYNAQGVKFNLSVDESQKVNLSSLSTGIFTLILSFDTGKQQVTRLVKI